MRFDSVAISTCRHAAIFSRFSACIDFFSIFFFVRRRFMLLLHYFMLLAAMPALAAQSAPCCHDAMPRYASFQSFAVFCLCPRASFDACYFARVRR